MLSYYNRCGSSTATTGKYVTDIQVHPKELLHRAQWRKRYRTTTYLWVHDIIEVFPGIGSLKSTQLPEVIITANAKISSTLHVERW